jgi:type II secretory pathway pseudopilin PulG
MAWRILTINRRRAAFTIAEAMVASTVLAIAVVGIAGPLGAASEQARILNERGTALTLARELMEEIAAKPLCDGGTTCHLGPESGETDRSKYDSADDYNTYHDTTATLNNLSGQSEGFDPNVIYTRDVTVEYRTSPSGTSAGSGDYGLVTVSVTTPHNQVVKLSRLLCKVALGN